MEAVSKNTEQIDAIFRKIKIGEAFECPVKSIKTLRQAEGPYGSKPRLQAFCESREPLLHHFSACKLIREL